MDLCILGISSIMLKIIHMYMKYMDILKSWLVPLLKPFCYQYSIEIMVGMGILLVLSYWYFFARK